MTEEQVNAAVDNTTPEQPTIDYSWMDNATTEEPTLAGPTTFVGTLVKFAPGTAFEDPSRVSNWVLDIQSGEELATNLGGKFPVGKTFSNIRVYTAPKEGATPDEVKQTNGRNLRYLAALFGVATARNESAATISGKLRALGVPLVPGPTDASQPHYDQHVGKQFQFSLKPGKVNDKGYMNYYLQAIAPVPVATT